MEISLFRNVHGGLIVARSTDLSDAQNDSFELVSEAEIPHEVRLTADNPDLQNLLRVAFIDGVNWARNNPDKHVEK